MPEEMPEEKIEEIIRRLRREEAPLKPTKAAAKGAMVGVAAPPQEGQAFDWRKPRAEFKSAKGFLGGIGKLYLTLEKPLVGLASQLSKLSAAKNLSNQLDAAGMRMSPEAYLVTVAASAVAIAVFVVLIILVATVGTELESLGTFAMAPLALAAFIFVAIIGVIWPSFKANGRAALIDRELPFALRQLATQTKAGVSFAKALGSIARSDYGVLSEEARRVLHDLDAGSTSEEALLALAARTRSTGLRRAIIQIVRAVRTGGSLAAVLSAIANDVSFETRMKIRDFTERLNLISVVYIMVAVVAPVAMTIIASVLQLPLFSGMLPPYVLTFAFMLDVMAMGAILLVIMRMEPT
jgi:flagellar protein FlaJ